MEILPLKPVQYPTSQDDVFYSGLYLFTAETAEGKTLHALALAKWLAGDFLYLNEPRAPYIASVPEASSLLTLRTGVKMALVSPEMFTQYINDEANTSKIVVVDSFNYFIRANSKGLGIGGGLTPDQFDFILRTNNACVNRKVLMIGTLNSNLLPRAFTYTGVCEGIIKLTKQNLSKADRSNRKDRSLTIPKSFLDAAVRDLCYGDEYVYLRKPAAGVPTV